MELLAIGRPNDQRHQHRKARSREEGPLCRPITGVDGEAELRFTVRGPSLIRPDHTEAPVSMRGTGVAMALVEHMIGDAGAEGFKIIPICPHVLAQYRKHPEWSDVMTNGPAMG